MEALSNLDKDGWEKVGEELICSRGLGTSDNCIALIRCSYYALLKMEFLCRDMDVQVNGYSNTKEEATNTGHHQVALPGC